MNGVTQVGNDDRGKKRLYRMTKEWDESSATWASLSGGVSTWGNNQIDLNFNTKKNVWEDYDVTATIQNFINGEEENYGFCMGYRLDDFGCYYFSSEYSDISKRPKLVIEYSPTNIKTTVSEKLDQISFLNLDSEIMFEIPGKGFAAEIVDVRGAVAKSFVSGDDSFSILKRDFASGIYFLKVNVNGIYYSKKFVISK